MSSAANEAQEPTDGRTWRQYFPKGDLWVFGYGWVWHLILNLDVRWVNLSMKEFDMEASASLRYVQTSAV